jgi:predicted methyltransferase
MAAPPVLSLAHTCVAAVLAPGGTAIDATAGNGHDTLFLAECVGDTGRVFAFDIQPEALAATRHRLTTAGAAGPVTLCGAGHETLADTISDSLQGRVDAAMFNLGYLPRGDKSVITRPETTVPALRQALSLLRPGGMLTVVIYRGHAGGPAEGTAVMEWAAALALEDAHVRSYRTLNRPAAPHLLAIERSPGQRSWPPR